MGKKLFLFLIIVSALFFMMIQVVHEYGFKKTDKRVKVEKEELVKIPSKKIKKAPSKTSKKVASVKHK